MSESRRVIRREGSDSAEELRGIVERLVAAAADGEQIEAVVSRSGGVSVKAYRGEVESLTSAEGSAIGIRVLQGDRTGFAHAGSLDPEVIWEVLAEARDNVRFAEPDPDQVLATDDGVEPIRPPQLWNDAVLADPVEAKVARAVELERLAVGSDPRVTRVRTASYGDSWGESAIASTSGIYAYSRGTWCSASVSAMATSGAETQMGYGYDVARDPGQLDLAKASADAVERSTRLLGAVKPPSGKMAIVCEPRIAATLMSIVAGMCSGEAVVKGRSPFTGRIGETVGSPLLTLADDPTDPRSFGAEEFDGEGLACRRNLLIDGGRLDGYLHNSYTARRMQTLSTASAVRGARSLPGVGAVAWSLAPGSGTLDDLIGSVELGLLVNSFAGLHSGVNPVSGDFSVGADGVMIRNGELAEPVRELTLASTIQRMLAAVLGVGADLEFLPGGSTMPTVIVGDMSVSGS